MSAAAIILHAQKAFAAHLATKTFTWTYGSGATATPVIRRGISASVKTLPAIIVDCTQAEHEPSGIWTGNWILDVMVSLRENADECTEDEHLTHADNVHEHIITDTIASDVNTVATGYLVIQAQGVGTPGRFNYGIIERSWQSDLTFRVHCHV